MITELEFKRLAAQGFNRIPLIAEAFSNLLSNAVKFTREGEVRLTVSHAREMAVFEVSDTGPGIPCDRLSELFQPFNRLGAEGSRCSARGPPPAPSAASAP